jgi:hypothetical protein
LTGSANGEALLSMGEWTDVASAKRGVRGTLSELSDEELEDVAVRACVRLRAAGRFFSPKLKPAGAGVSMGAGSIAPVGCSGEGGIVSCVSVDGPELSMVDFCVL